MNLTVKLQAETRVTIENQPQGVVIIQVLCKKYSISILLNERAPVCDYTVYCKIKPQIFISTLKWAPKLAAKSFCCSLGHNKKTFLAP